MPKIGKIRLRIDTKDHNEYDVWYKSGHGFYIRDGVPEDFYLLTGCPVAFNTEKLLNDDFVRYSIEYRKMKEQKRIVIMYRCCGSTNIVMNKINNYRNGGHHYSGRLPGISNSIETLPPGVNGTGISVEYEVIFEMDQAGQKTFYYVDENFKPLGEFKMGTREYSVMEYSESAHRFFMEIELSMGAMLRKMSLFFGLEGSDAAKLIESGFKPLLTGGASEHGS